jgi:hypothetical protein
MEALLPVADHEGPTMFARIGVMRALRRHEPKAAAVPRRKRAKVYGIVRIRPRRHGLNAKVGGFVLQAGDCFGEIAR